MATLVLQPDETASEDTSIVQNLATSNYGSGTSLWAGNFNTASGNARRSLIRFDISAIPAGSTITAATLTLRTSAVFPASTFHNVTIHRALTQFFETGSTWNLRNTSGSVAWAGGAGGGSGTDRVSTPTATVSVGASNTFYDFNVLADVQAWFAGTATNYGWWILGPEGAAQIQKEFNSANTGTAANRPKLTITYTPPPSSDMTGTASGSSSASGTMKGRIAISGSATGSSSASGELIDFPKGKGSEFEDDVLNLILNGIGIANIADNAASTPLENLYLSLHTAVLDDDSLQSTAEATYVGYSRLAVPRDGTAWNVANGVASNAIDLAFAAGAGGTEDILSIAIGTDATGDGKVLFYGTVVFPLTIIIGTVPRFEIGELQVIED
jgi:hypothetical protein